MEDLLNPTEEQLLSAKQAAEYYGINEGNFNKNVKKGKINPVSTDKSKKYRKEDLDSFKASRKAKKAHKDSDSPTELIVDTEFQVLIPPLSEAEYAKLVESCKSEGIREPIILWGKTILDGHNRYRISQEFNLPFKTAQAPCHTREEAAMWMVNNQFARRNMNKYGRCLVALKLKPLIQEDSQKRMLAGKLSDDPMQISAQGATRDILAKMAGVSHDTLTKVERLELEAPKDLKDKLLAGNISINGAIKELNKSSEPPTVIQANTAMPDIPDEIVTEETITAAMDSHTNSNPDISQNNVSADNDSLPSDISICTAQDSTSTEDIPVIKADMENAAPVAVPVNDESQKENIQPQSDLSSTVPTVPPVIHKAMEAMQSCISNFHFYSSSQDLEISWRGNVILQPPQELVHAFAEKLNRDKDNIEHVIFVISGNNDSTKYIFGIPSENINIFFV